MTYKVQLVWWTNPQEKQKEVEIEAENAITAIQQAQDTNPGYFGVSAEII